MHYTFRVCKVEEDKWVEFNDEITEELSEDELNRLITSKEPYILFYKPTKKRSCFDFFKKICSI